MNKKIGLLILALLVVSSIIACYGMPTAKTIIWKEGHITADETWFYIPNAIYRVIGNVYVDPNVTLTIMPGVEVQFADGLSLIVQGSFNASGTLQNPIIFTSSRVENDPPDPFYGSWYALEFSGSKTEHFTINCARIEYAQDGIWVTSLGKTIIENSEFTKLWNGIAITGHPAWGGHAGNILIKNNRIYATQHAFTGIYIDSLGHNGYAGISNITISGNTISSSWNQGISVDCRGSLPDSYGNIRNVTISGNTISSCRYTSGIRIKSYGYASIRDMTISNNRIFSNKKDGIHLNATDYLAVIRNVTISDNIVSSNEENGISLYGYGGDLSGVTIYNNSISENKKGINVVYHANDINVTNNDISYNVYGVFYDTTFGHLARNNSIYYNSYGMYVINGATVNAECNYWGDPTGPYHPSQNPEGKGNPVNGHGEDLDFIPFLTGLPPINERPIAKLSADKSTVNIDEAVKFDGTASTDDGRIDYYFFDFGDGTNSSWTTLPMVTHKYSQEGKYNATLIVMDDHGVTSLDSNEVYVEITVVPEFPSALILSLFMIATLLAAVVYRRKTSSVKEKENKKNLFSH